MRCSAEEALKTLAAPNFTSIKLDVSPSSMHVCKASLRLLHVGVQRLECSLEMRALGREYVSMHHMKGCLYPIELQLGALM